MYLQRKITQSSRVEATFIFIRTSTTNPVFHVCEIDKSFLKMKEEVFLLNNYLSVKVFTWQDTCLFYCSQLYVEYSCR